ncbi:MAG TPA: type II toxin-antitoxin system VapC family toxin [Desulfobacterales bacterium]|nr:type II toxin-antitoxin system VapC family toxin [Desulfobacterales bacterium]
MRYILDTNTLIYFFKGVGHVAEHLLAVPPKDIGLPAIVVFELKVGIAKSTSPKKRKIQLKQLTEVVNVLPFGFDEACHAADIRAGLEAQGRPIGPYDILIAATALSKKGTLVTHNIKEFNRIEGLQIEDWF